MFDVVLRNGRVLDGTGQAEQRLDIGIRDGLIAAVEPRIDIADSDVAEVIDATGRLVTPGWVDIHSHYDGQATWDSLLEPSSGHGVTTVVVGNCGVGFAPVHPGEHEPLVKLMEGVEDIPGAALAEGMRWGWESFPDYLDTLGSMQWSVDVGAQLPHGPLRSYVMRRYDTNGAASTDHVAQMARLAREAMEAGAFGFSTSRTLGHRSSDGTPVPGTYAAEEELAAIARGVADGGGAILEIAPSGLARSDDPAVVAEEFEWIGRLAAASGLATTFALLQGHHVPDRWRAEQQAAARWRASGARVTPLIAGRQFGILWGWDVRHPFMARDSYRALAHLPLAGRLEELRRPEVRVAILGEQDVHTGPGSVTQMRFIRSVLPDCFPLVDPPDYEQPREQSLGARAEALGESLEAVAYDALVTGSGTMLLYSLYNYAGGDHQVLYEQLQDSEAVLGLSDGGAHCAYICDASIPTFMLTHWSRDRSRGPRFAVPEVVRRLTSQPADLYGMTDRGRIHPGLRADLNVIDYDALQLALPHAVSDLPAGGTRLLQPAFGYDLTLVAGQVTRRQGQDTGARPGRLVRH